MNIKSEIAPKDLEFKSSEFVISDKYATILTVITYPKGWMLVYNKDGGGIAYCPECYEKHKTELETVRVQRGSYD